MFSNFNASVFDSAFDFIKNFAESLSYEYILYGLLGVFLIYAIFTFIKTRFSYEVRAIRSFKKINKYFLKKPYIDESNLVEFNKKMKKLPYQLRDRWQYFMLNREGLPSTYMTLYHCVEQPIKTSSYNSTVSLARNLSNIVIAISLVLCFALLADASITSLAKALIGPALFFVLAEIYLIFLRSRFNALSIDLYEYFLIFTRNLDKASVSIPDYVDYELLFTSKEIREGIPVLREYLEKKAVADQLALEKAKYNLEQREKFDFSKYGIDGSLILERAMETSQDYLNTRRRLLEEISKLEKEKDADTERYEYAEKDAQKKLQAIRENLDRLQIQLEEASTRIEQNYIRGQQDAEVAKRSQIEKDLEDLRTKFNQEVTFLDSEIQKRQAEMNTGKQEAQEAMSAEFETYSQKVYSAIQNQIESDRNDELNITKQELAETQEKLETETQNLENKTVEMELKDQEIDTLKSQYTKASEELEKYNSTDKNGIKKLYEQNDALNARLTGYRDLLIAYKEQNNETVYFDENKNFVDIEALKNKKGYFDELPVVFDKNGNEINFANYYDNQGNLLEGVENAPPLSNYNYVEEQPIESIEQTNDQELPQEQQPIETQEEYTYYDENGNPVDMNQYYNEDGSFKEFPKVYDAEGNYYDFADYYDIYGNPLTGEENTEQQAEEQPQEEQPAEQTDEVVYYDENGNPVDFTQYYNEDGSFKEFPKVYDAEGNYYDFADYYDIYGNPLTGEENTEQQVQEQPQQVEEQPAEQTDEVVYYDENGNPVDFDQYYNEDGTLKELPKVYDAEGNYYDFADYYDLNGNLLSEQNQSEEPQANDVQIQQVIDNQDETTKQEEQQISDNAQNNANIAQVSDDNQTTQTSKRGRGRPKKTDQDKSNSKNKKHRIKRVNSENLDDNKLNKEPKKRGRKPKNQEKLEESKTKKSSTKKEKTKKTAGKDKTTTSKNKNSASEKAKKETSKKQVKNKAEESKKTQSKKVDTKKKSSAKNKKSDAKKSSKTTSSKTKKQNKPENKDEELKNLDNKINEANEQLKKQQSDLKSQISQTLSELQTTSTADSNLTELKEIVAKLKKQASEAKKNGLSKEEQQKINKSLAELLKAMAQKK